MKTAHHIKVDIGGNHLCTVETDADQRDALDSQLLKFRSVAQDLQIVQNHTNTYFPMPAEWTGLERVYLRCLRLLIEGECVALPNAGTLTVNLQRPDVGGPRIAFMEQPDFGFEIFGHDLKVGRTYIYGPTVTAENGTEALEAVERGEGKDFPVRLKPGGGNKYFWAFKPDLRTDETVNPLPVPWGLADIPEPADLSPT